MKINSGLSSMCTGRVFRGRGWVSWELVTMDGCVGFVHLRRRGHSVTGFEPRRLSSTRSPPRAGRLPRNDFRILPACRDYGVVLWRREGTNVVRPRMLISESGTGFGALNPRVKSQRTEDRIQKTEFGRRNPER